MHHDKKAKGMMVLLIIDHIYFMVHTDNDIKDWKCTMVPFSPSDSWLFIKHSLPNYHGFRGADR
jgi:hypothetical protein